MTKLFSNYTQESIGFQDGSFFRELISQLSVIKLNYLEIENAGVRFFESKDIMSLRDIIKKHTGLNIILLDGGITGPSAVNPAISVNHTLVSDKLKGYFSSEALQEDILGHGQPKSSAFVDIHKSRVGGVYAEIPFYIYMPKSMFLGRPRFNTSEIAAIFLHEIGHIFTFLEYVSRTMTTNLVLSNIFRTLSKITSEEERQIVFVDVTRSMELSKVAAEELRNAKSDSQISIILINAANNKCVSELGSSLYASVNAEFLADQFATRHGAGKDLVIALSKEYGNPTVEKIINFGGTAMAIIGYLAMPVIVIAFVSIALSNREDAIYDKNHSRLNRIKIDALQQLKDPNASQQQKQHASETIVAMNVVIKKYSDNLTLIEKIAYVLDPSYRKAHKNEILQKDLENIGSSDLFLFAEKFKSKIV